MDREQTPIEGAVVTVDRISNTTDQWGVASFSGLLPGSHRVVATKADYFNGTAVVEILDGAETNAKILLVDPPPTRLRKPWTYAGSAECDRARLDPSDVKPCPDRYVPTLVPGKNAYDGDFLPQFLESFNLTVNWTGPVGRFRVTLSFGGSTQGQIPLADGRRNVTVEGASPIRFELPREAFWGPLHRGGTLRLQLEPLEAPAEYTQRYDIRGDGMGIWYIADDAGPRWLPRPTRNLTITPGGAAASFEHGTDLDFLYVRHQPVSECPVPDWGPLRLRFTDPQGNEHVLTLIERDDPPSPALSCPAFRPRLDEYLPRVPGVWGVRAEGTCSCSVKLEVVPMVLDFGK